MGVFACAVCSCDCVFVSAPVRSFVRSFDVVDLCIWLVGFSVCVRLLVCVCLCVCVFVRVFCVVG